MLAQLLRAIVPLSFLLLAACAQTPPAVQAPPSAQTQAALTHFRIEGKLAWNAEGSGGSSRFVWERQNDIQRIDLLSPLGTVAAQIVASPQEVVLDMGSDGRASAPSLELLTERLFKLPLPLTGMEYWAQGLPVPGSSFVEETLPGGRRLLQRGMTLDYTQWMQVGEYSLPQSIDISQGAMTLKLRIRQWHLQPSNGQ